MSLSRQHQPHTLHIDCYIVSVTHVFLQAPGMIAINNDSALTLLQFCYLCPRVESTKYSVFLYLGLIVMNSGSSGTTAGLISTQTTTNNVTFPLPWGGFDHQCHDIRFIRSGHSSLCFNHLYPNKEAIRQQVQPVRGWGHREQTGQHVTINH